MQERHSKARQAVGLTDEQLERELRPLAVPGEDADHRREVAACIHGCKSSASFTEVNMS
jgi:hypothetical protein